MPNKTTSLLNRLVLRMNNMVVSLMILVCAGSICAQQLDETWRLTVAGQTITPNPDGSFRIPNIPTPDQFGAGGPGTSPDFIGDDFVRLTGVGRVDGETRYVFSEPFRICQGAVFGIDPTALIFTDVPPPLHEQIVLTASAHILTEIGQTVQLSTIATLVDGETQDVTPRSSWTTYRSSNSGILAVNENGVVSGRSPGIAVVTAVNEGATAVIRTAVVQGDPLAKIDELLK